MSSDAYRRMISDDESDPSILQYDTESSAESIPFPPLRPNPQTRVISCEPERRTARTRLTARKTTGLPQRVTLPAPSREEEPVDSPPPAPMPVPAPQRVGPRMITTARKTVRMRVPQITPPKSETPQPSSPRAAPMPDESVASRAVPAYVSVREYLHFRDYVAEGLGAHSQQWHMQRMLNADRNREIDLVNHVTATTRRMLDTTREDARRFRAYATAWALLVTVIMIVCIVVHFLY